MSSLRTQMHGAGLGLCLKAVLGTELAGKSLTQRRGELAEASGDSAGSLRAGRLKM
jgi:hypothetical protein